MVRPIPEHLLIEAIDIADTSGPRMKPIAWRCSKDSRHVWSASINQRMKGPNCPFCLNRRIMAGVNDLATLDPTLAAQLVDPQVGSTVSPSSSKRLEWQCPDHPEHRWFAKVNSRATSGSGCPQCAHFGPRPEPEQTPLPDRFVLELVNPRDAIGTTAGSGKMLQWQCPNDPAHRWYAVVANRTRHNTGCPACADRSAIQTPRS